MAMHEEAVPDVLVLTPALHGGPAPRSYALPSCGLMARAERAPPQAQKDADKHYEGQEGQR